MATVREPSRRRPDDAATIILTRDSRLGPELLMGRRGNNHVFMAGMYVFPGGRVDAADARVRTADELRPDVARRLAKSCTPGRARALALAAIRELYEEAGLMLGAAALPSPKRSPPGHSVPGVGFAQAGARPPNGRPLAPTWRAFAEAGLSPSLQPIEYVARAITPPGRARRFHARFLLADARHAHGRLAGDGELVDLRWVPLARARTLPTAGITRVILEELALRLADRERRLRPIPVFKTRGGRDIAVDYD